ncbi:MAG: hypothetical protein K2L94_01980 [Alphaproteobacteria bacterium]|nr:hypothetical protein [Alphaproteobacteria bacterium]
MAVNKFKIIAYVLCRRMQGYQLLRNPAGTPGTSVKMIKARHWISPFTLDVYSTHDTVSVDFSDSNNHEKNEYLVCIRYAFWDESASKINYQKEMRYYKMRPAPVITRHKNIMDSDILGARNLAYINQVVGKTTGFKPVLFGFLLLGHRAYDRDITRGENMVNQFRDAHAHRRHPRGFLKTLYHNLSR